MAFVEWWGWGAAGVDCGGRLEIHNDIHNIDLYYVSEWYKIGYLNVARSVEWSQHAYNEQVLFLYL